MGEEECVVREEESAVREECAVRAEESAVRAEDWWLELAGVTRGARIHEVVSCAGERSRWQSCPNMATIAAIATAAPPPPPSPPPPTTDDGHTEGEVFEGGR